ncbi:hypothetical protein PM082_014717 [Marasmius tenuissimus]|nr:hypothetical protein PM082_014717 [Marasmius tenuissimus]
MAYIKGTDNTGADALSHVPENCFPLESAFAKEHLLPPVVAVLKISADAEFLASIREGYCYDDWVSKLSEDTPGVEKCNGLWLLGSHLVVPQFGSLREDLFCLAHDSVGHFGADKNYHMLWDSYYWPVPVSSMYYLTLALLKSILYPSHS